MVRWKKMFRIMGFWWISGLMYVIGSRLCVQRMIGFSKCFLNFRSNQIADLCRMNADSRSLVYLPSVMATATMILVIKKVDPANALDYQNRLKGFLEVNEVCSIVCFLFSCYIIKIENQLDKWMHVYGFCWINEFND